VYPGAGYFAHAQTDAHSRHQCKHGNCCCCGPRIATHQSNVQSPLCALIDASCLTCGIANSPARDWRADRQSCVSSHKFQDQGTDTMRDYCKSRIHYPVHASIWLAGESETFQAGSRLQPHSDTWSNRRVQHHIYTSSHREMVAFSDQFFGCFALRVGNPVAGSLASRGTMFDSHLQLTCSSVGPRFATMHHAVVNTAGYEAVAVPVGFWFPEVRFSLSNAACLNRLLQFT
jgi:hypothetical protein